MANHLIIGLGGTGGKVIRELRKRIYEEFHSNDPGQGVFIDYVYVDSSLSDLEDLTGWSVLGKSVQLGKAQKVNIHGISTSVLQNINLYPGLKGFLNPSDLQLMQRELGSLISKGEGGQRRRLGRTLLANNICDKNSSSNFDKIVRQAVSRLQQASGYDDVTFHICAGLAGGTGSGSIVDAIAQIRTAFPYQEDTNAFKMRLFLYTPERQVVNIRNGRDLYQANGYAALLELNAMSLNKYQPTDVAGNTDIFTGEIQRLLDGQDAFEAAYIYTNVNEQGKVLDLDKGLPSAVADFIFQTTIASELGSTNGQLNRLVGCENDGAAPERDQSGQNAHSRKFLSFGITRVEFPVIEILEYATYRFAQQAARQLSYNKWLEGIGYGECTLDEVGIGFADEIKDKKNREGLLLSNNYLTLATPLVESPATKRWKPIDETWETRTQASHQDILATVEKKMWISELTQRCDTYYNSEFRGHGVVEFYRIQRQELRGYARTIRRHIEKKLFDEWAGGANKSKSILEIEKYTRLLVADCGDRIQTMDKQLAKMSEELNSLAEEIKNINIEWDLIKRLPDIIIGRSRKVFGKFRTAKCEYCATATRIEAYKYAKELLNNVIIELNNMLDGVLKFKDELSAINEEVVHQAEDRCKSQDELSYHVIKKSNAEEVRRIVGEFTRDFEKMSSNAAGIRTLMVTALGEDGEHTFANLYDKTDYTTAMGIFLDICQENAMRALEETAKRDPLYRMVSVNIMEKLQQELNTDAKLEQFVNAVVASSRSYVQFDPKETAMVIPGNTGAMMSMVQLALPKTDERYAAFRTRLIDAFVQNVPGFDPNQDVAENYKENQLCVISANSGFPLRFLSNVKVCKEKYDALVTPQNAKRDLNLMVLHTETFKDKLTPLFEMTPEEIKQLIVKPLMMAYALGLISEQQDPTTGARFEAVGVPDPVFGGMQLNPLGRGFVDSWEMLSQDFTLAQTLMELVRRELAVKARSNDQKAALRAALDQVVKTRILPSELCENNQFNPNYTKFRNLAVELINEELKDL